MSMSWLKFGRTFEKPVWLLVNFVDDPSLESEAADFYSIGFPKTIFVSGLNNRNISFLRKEIIGYFQNYKKDSEKKLILKEHNLKLVFAGKPNTGKSTLFNYFLKKEIALTSNIPGTTRDSLEDMFTFYKRPISIIDTAGLKKKSSLRMAIEIFSMSRTKKAIEESDVVIFLIDPMEGFDRQNKTIMRLIYEANKPLVLGINKDDLLSPKRKKEIIEEVNYIQSVFWKFPFFFISAKNGKNTSKLLEKVIEIYEKVSQKIATSKINRVLEKLKGSPFFTSHQVKLKYMLQCFPKTIFLLFGNQDSLPDNISKFLTSAIQKNLNLEDIPVKIISKKTNKKLISFEGLKKRKDVKGFKF